VSRLRRVAGAVRAEFRRGIPRASAWHMKMDAPLLPLSAAPLLLLLLTSAAGCSGSSPPLVERDGDSMTDLSPAADHLETGDTADHPAAPDGPEGGVCCPIGVPSCNGFSIGGFATSLARCGLLYDAAPVGWKESVDAHGCPILKSDDGRSCLGGFPDAATQG
jgi:hypothetical protein